MKGPTCQDYEPVGTRLAWDVVHVVGFPFALMITDRWRRAFPPTTSRAGSLTFRIARMVVVPLCHTEVTRADTHCFLMWTGLSPSPAEGLESSPALSDWIERPSP